MTDGWSPPALGAALGRRAVEQRILVAGHGTQLVKPAVVDIDMAGRAHCVATASRRPGAIDKRNRMSEFRR